MDGTLQQTVDAAPESLSLSRRAYVCSGRGHLTGTVSGLQTRGCILRRDHSQKATILALVDTRSTEAYTRVKMSGRQLPKPQCPPRWEWWERCCLSLCEQGEHTAPAQDLGQSFCFK